MTTTLDKIKAELQRQADEFQGPWVSLNPAGTAIEVDGTIDLAALAAAIDANTKAVVEHPDGTVSYITDVSVIDGTIRGERPGDVFRSDLPPPFRPWSPKIIRVMEIEGRGLIFVVEADERFEIGRRDLLNRILTLDGATYAVTDTLYDVYPGGIVEKGQQFGVCVQKVTEAET